MKTAGPKMHFVPLGDINETPHINDTGSIPLSQILHLSTGPKQADPAPIQARDLFVLEKTIVRKRITNQGLLNAGNQRTTEQKIEPRTKRVTSNGLALIAQPVKDSGNTLISVVSKPSLNRHEQTVKLMGFPKPELQCGAEVGRVFNNNPSLTHFEVAHFGQGWKPGTSSAGGVTGLLI